MPASFPPRRRAEGIVVRHSRRCASLGGGSCDCHPAYQAQVFSRRDGKTIRKTFSTLSEARAWRAEGPDRATSRRQCVETPGNR
jgi:hypothetical protein